ncbi:glutamine-rich protein 2 isoform X2 [Aplysia californica]|uniref:Glutamine-rich protein 2 isoform X2 n=1 Tax=Aplysia californica TaxID=6500 RepID=A0ABM0JTU2_APLCA|nr:glutamine-rich protein 2 isoform X2 [Aplysia californica]
MPTPVPLTQLVDLALGSPEVGAVNFNVLHTLLHAMISKLNIQDVKADIEEHDRELLSTHAGPRSFSAFSADSGKGDDSILSEDNLSEKSGYSAPKRSPYHRLEKQVSELTKQMEELNKLPSNEHLLQRTQEGKESDRPITDMWQYMQLKKRVDANEEGVGKLMSLFEDLMKEMKDLKNAQKDIMDKLNGINLDEINKRLNDMDALFKELNDKYNDFNDKISNMPGFDDLEQYVSQFVTWPGLEDALKGIRQDFENLQPITEERVVIELATQTETPPVSRPTSGRPISRASSARSRMSSAGPSSELLDVLEKLGQLADAHAKLTLRVDELERLLELKANKADLEGLGISDDLLTTLKNLQEELQAVRDGQLKDEAALKRLQEALQKLQSDIDKLRESMETVIEENAQRVKEIQDLLNYCDSLNEKKADKEYVDIEVDVKADRRQLEGKVNHSLFDSTTNELNKMIKDILDKLNGQEGDWKSALAKAMEELDGKLDRRELSNLKDWLEKQLKMMNSKIKSMGPGWNLEDEAAGMKRQLIQRFHCLSCDKPVDVMPHGPIPSIPANYGLPKSKSPRPYTTFELDQIRQHARSLGMNPEATDYYATIRQCGGSHTLTHPHKRTTKLNNLGQLFREEETIMPIYKEEVDVQGADGHIYKGRMESARLEAKLPSNLTGQQSPQPVYMEKRTYSPQPPQRPMSGRVPRGSSGRPDSSRSAHRMQVSMPGRVTESVVAPENSQVGGSRATTPHQEDASAAVEIVADQNAPEEPAQQQEEQQVEESVVVDAQNSTEDDDNQ